MAESLNISRKEQILQTSARLFREKGFAATTMRDIASAMHIEAASLYHHIHAKEEILESICFDMAARLLSALKEVNDIYFNAEEKLRMAIRLHVGIITSNLDQAAVFLNEWKSLPEPRLAEFRLLRDQYENEFRELVRSGIHEDVFAEVDPKFAALTILSSVNWIYQWYSPTGRMSPDELANQLSDFIFSGLRKKLVTDVHPR